MSNDYQEFENNTNNQEKSTNQENTTVRQTAADFQSAADYAARIYAQYAGNGQQSTASDSSATASSSGPDYGNDNKTANTQGAADSTVYQQYTNAAAAQQAPKKGIVQRFNESRFVKKVAIVCVLALLFGCVSGGAFSVTNHYVRAAFGDSNVALNVTTPVTSGGNTNDGGTVAEVVANCMPSVVAITNKGVTEVRTFFGTFQQESQSNGSGVIIGQNDSELMIVTNYHVIAGSNQLTVVFSFEENQEKIKDSDIVQASIKGYDATKDIAIIAVKLSDLSNEILSNIRIATLGDSNELVLGQQVVAIGNALGYGQSVTVGYVSALSRELTLQGVDGTTIKNEYLQTDAAINPGNSGGALLNMKGELIGINSAKVETVEAEAMGYAIAMANVEPIMESILDHASREEVAVENRGYLGITGQDVTTDAQQMYGMPEGVYIEAVTEGAGADKAGIVKGNIISKVDGYAVTGMSELKNMLKYYKAGEHVSVTIYELGMNGYTEQTLSVTLSDAKTAGITN